MGISMAIHAPIPHWADLGHGAPADEIQCRQNEEIMSYVMMPDGTSLPLDDVDVDLPDEVYAAIAAFALRGAYGSRRRPHFSSATNIFNRPAAADTVQKIKPDAFFSRPVFSSYFRAHSNRQSAALQP